MHVCFYVCACVYVCVHISFVFLVSVYVWHILSVIFATDRVNTGLWDNRCWGLFRDNDREYNGIRCLLRSVWWVFRCFDLLLDSVFGATVKNTNFQISMNDINLVAMQHSVQNLLNALTNIQVLNDPSYNKVSLQLIMFTLSAFWFVALSTLWNRGEVKTAKNEYAAHVGRNAWVW